MKKLILAVIVLYGAVSCTNTPVNKVQATDAQLAVFATGQQLTVDSKASTLYWKGTKAGGMHDGTIGIKDGSLMLSADHQVTAGAFTIDMNAIENFDLKGDEKLQSALLNHLKSADFFEVETYPTATFTITKVEEAAKSDTVTHYIAGNLKIKDVEKNIRFGANITAEVVKSGGEYKTIYRAETVPFTIDRTEWNVKFGSKKLFPDLTEMIVNDNIELKITIVANATAVK